jgi:hypothetical protein
VLVRAVDRGVHAHRPVDLLDRVSPGEERGLDVVPGPVLTEPTMPLPHRLPGPERPERIGPDRESRWAGILDTPVLRATTSWERIELGPATLASGEVVEAARVVEIPTALRLDFSTGPVWFAAAIPQYPSMERVFIPGDEIMIVFSAAKMRDMGYDDPRFVA